MDMHIGPARYLFGILALATLASACTPVMDPGHWDPTVYCATVRPPDPWCKTHGH